MWRELQDINHAREARSIHFEMRGPVQSNTAEYSLYKRCMLMILCAQVRLSRDLHEYPIIYAYIVVKKIRELETS